MKNLIYRMFYKKSAEKTMMAMENCQAYIDYKNSCNKYCEINDTAIKDTIVHIDLARERAISNGQFYCVYELSRRLTKENRRYLKNHYLSQGYKVKITLSDIVLRDRLIELSWKHWR